MLPRKTPDGYDYRASHPRVSRTSSVAALTMALSGTGIPAMIWVISKLSFTKPAKGRHGLHGRLRSDGETSQFPSDIEKGGRPRDREWDGPGARLSGENNTSPIKSSWEAKVLQWFNEARMTNPAEKIFRGCTTFSLSPEDFAVEHACSIGSLCRLHRSLASSIVLGEAKKWMNCSGGFRPSTTGCTRSERSSSGLQSCARMNRNRKALFGLLNRLLDNYVQEFDEEPYQLRGRSRL